MRNDYSPQDLHSITKEVRRMLTLLELEAELEPLDDENIFDMLVEIRTIIQNAASARSKNPHKLTP